jgi:hypothetical protein
LELCRNDSLDLVYECELDFGELSFLFVVFGLLCGASQSLWQAFPEPLGDRSIGLALERLSILDIFKPLDGHAAVSGQERKLSAVSFQVSVPVSLSFIVF